MRLLSLDLHLVRALNAASRGALYRIARVQIARNQDPQIVVVRAAPRGLVPVRWFLADGSGVELVELLSPEGWALAAHVHLHDEAERLREEIKTRVAIEHGASGERWPANG